MMKKYFLLVSAALAVSIPIIPAVVQGAQSEYASRRADALRGFSSQRKRILSNINSDPAEVSHRLIWEVVRPMGDDPRVLELCDQLVSQSTNPITAVVAFDAVGGILDLYAEQIKSSGGTKKILLLIDKGLGHKEMRVKIAALKTLQSLGAEGQSKQSTAYMKVFRDTPVVQVNYETNLEMLRLVLPFVKDAKVNPAHRQILKSAAEKYNLMSILRSRVDDPALVGTPKEKLQAFETWKEIMLSK